ncbi:hypothetical protein Clacol_003998 [Clathrus columnatus]|uniref:U3 small nucleolar RNA-associated protein 11 n=1 Tax=Clathrus columnatus TaxID=1419009 RepID=A0AAV5AAP6_9AGAM|nr:hypothetical protein Clacol_003998 [Clathrus columnatus]
MSSLRNSLHRRNHKERSQLGHRSRLGILEKHSDYVKRARDFHSKQERIKRLKEKAAERNKDEFYFGMIKSRTQGGVHTTDRGNAVLPLDFVKILKTQDENYVRAVRQTNLKKIDKLKAELTTWADLTHPGHLGDDGEDDLDEEENEILREAGILAAPPRKAKREPKHVIFVSDKTEATNYTPPKSVTVSPKASTDTLQKKNVIDLGWDLSKKGKNSTRKKPSPLKAEEMEQTGEIEESGETEEIARNHRSQLLKELAARLKRDRNLRYAGRELEMQRLLMGKGASRKIRGTTLVEGDEGKEDQDDLDARKGRRRKAPVGLEPKVYHPRVYKWKAERKK